jgi:hypothetical protein
LNKRHDKQKLLNFWKDADPGIAEVGGAKKRLAALRNKQNMD